MKLLATDMDGTFLRDDKSYNDEFNDLYKQMLKQGIQFVIASGNQYEALACKFDEEIKNDLYYLCENGTKIVYQGKTLYKKALKKEDAKEILDILKQDQECMLVVSGDKHAYISKSFEDKKDFISLFMKNVQFVESYDDIEDDILKFSIASFDDQMEQRIEKIQKQLKPHLKLVTTGNVWFDIFYKDVNKGTTLTHLLEILKIKPEESGAFGDQMNDYEMLQTVKYGYAMANAMPPVKEVAYQVIDSNENDGVILKIKEILKGIKSKYGVYACWGNHDLSEPILAGFTFRNAKEDYDDPRMWDFLKSANIRLLNDETLLIDDRFYLTGRKDPSRCRKMSDTRKEPDQLTASLDKTLPIIFIDHQPSQLNEVAAAGADLDLCGHTHDGQLFPLNIITGLVWENSCGYLNVDGMHNIVTSGVGVFGPDMRVGTKAEICPITVHFK